MNQIFIDFISNTHAQHKKHCKKASFEKKNNYVGVKRYKLNRGFDLPIGSSRSGRK